MRDKKRGKESTSQRTITVVSQWCRDKQQRDREKQKERERNTMVLSLAGRRAPIDLLIVPYLIMLAAGGEVGREVRLTPAPTTVTRILFDFI